MEFCLSFSSLELGGTDPTSLRALCSQWWFWAAGQVVGELFWEAAASTGAWATVGPRAPRLTAHLCPFQAGGILGVGCVFVFLALTWDDPQGLGQALLPSLLSTSSPLSPTLPPFPLPSLSLFFLHFLFIPPFPSFLLSSSLPPLRFPTDFLPFSSPPPLCPRPVLSKGDPQERTPLPSLP